MPKTISLFLILTLVISGCVMKTQLETERFTGNNLFAVGIYFTENSKYPQYDLDVSLTIYEELLRATSFSLLEVSSFQRSLVKRNLSGVKYFERSDLERINHFTGANYLFVSKVEEIKFETAEEVIITERERGEVHISGKIISIDDGEVLFRAEAKAHYSKSKFKFFGDEKNNKEELYKKAVQIAAKNLVRKLIEKM